MLNPAPDDDYDAVDMDALKRAMDIAARDPATAQQLKSKLESESWTAVAEFAAYHCQIRALGLAPWQSPPCHDDGPESTALLDEMLEAGISQFERIRSGRWPRPRSGADDRHCPPASAPRSRHTLILLCVPSCNLTRSLTVMPSPATSVWSGTLAMKGRLMTAYRTLSAAWSSASMSKSSLRFGSCCSSGIIRIAWVLRLLLGAAELMTPIDTPRMAQGAVGTTSGILGGCDGGDERDRMANPVQGSIAILHSDAQQRI
jgi:hypothetical protein